MVKFYWSFIWCFDLNIKGKIITMIFDYVNRLKCYFTKFKFLKKNLKMCKNKNFLKYLIMI